MEARKCCHDTRIARTTRNPSVFLDMVQERSLSGGEAPNPAKVPEWLTTEVRLPKRHYSYAKLVRTNSEPGISRSPWERSTEFIADKVKTSKND